VETARTFRTRLPLTIAVGAAAVFWAGVFAVLVTAPGVELRAIAGAGAFLAFFVLFTLVYVRTSITVTRDGIVAEGPFRRRPFRFEEILGVVVQDGLGGRVYAVLTRRGRVEFTSLIAGHRELFQLLLDRAALSPRSAGA
jgi:hypothetical protein